MSETRVARELARAIALLRRQWRIDGFADNAEFASLQLALERAADPNRLQPTFSALAAVEEHTASVLTYDLDQVAHQLHVTRRTVERLVANGELGVVQIGRAVRVPHNTLVEWISDRTVRRSQPELAESKD